MSLPDLLDTRYLTNKVIDFLPKLGAALLVLFFFWVLERLTRPALRGLLRRARIDDALNRLLVDNVYRFTILAFGVVMAAAQLGINIAAALAGIGVAGIAIGFAAQESLSNMIAGFLIFWDRPFEVGDYISLNDQYGRVQDITMRTTRIRTQENTYAVVPNKQIIGEMLVNHSMYGRTRVNVPVGIAYKEKIAEARRVMLEAVRGLEGVMTDPEPTVVALELGDSSVNLEVRVWISDASEEKPVFFRTIEACKVALDDAGIEIPFPHLQLFIEDVKDAAVRQTARIPRLVQEGDA